MVASVISQENFLYIRTYKGNHIIAEIVGKNSTYYQLNYPMEIGFAYDESGMGTSMFQEWIPLDFFDDNVIPFKRKDVMIEKAPTQKLILAYLDWRVMMLEKKENYRRAKEQQRQNPQQNPVDSMLKDIDDLGVSKELPKKRYLN